MDESHKPQLHNSDQDTATNFVSEHSNPTFYDTAESQIESEPSEDDDSAYSWQASEFIHHQKKTSWYGLLAIAVVALVGIAILTKQVLSVMVFIAMGGAVAVYANKEPRVLNYILSKEGVTVGEKLYRYNQFRSYAVFNDVAWHSIDLDPLQRFQARLTLMFDSNDLSKIEAMLSQHLPRIDRQPDIVERLTRTLKF